MKKKVIVAGHLCLDITPVFSGKKAADIQDVLRPGRLIRTEAVQLNAGGVVVNTGLAMKFFGADVSLMGKIGNDAFGKILLEMLRERGADAGMRLSEGESTSYTIVLAVPGVDRIFLYYPGANDTFCAADIPDAALREAALFHFGYPPTMRRFYENDGEELIRLYQRVKQAGAAASLDFSSIDADSEAAGVHWDTVIERVLPSVDFFLPSVEELCFMLDRNRFQQWQERAAGTDITETLDIEKDVRPLAERCMALGAKVLMIKCGAAGIYYRTADEAKLLEIGGRFGLDAAAWAGKEGFEKAYVPEKILSATGAGDSCIAAFLTSALEGGSLERSVQLAAAAGAACLTAYDALGGLKPLDELLSRIEAGWAKRE